MNKEIQRRVLDMWINKNMSVYDIADHIGISHKKLLKFIVNLKEKPLSDAELVCDNCTPGFLKYLKEQGHEI
tara:strand:- start:177 stop:392 length:216 start_codon:yes stop_codon:yes gene_type:complete